MIINGREVHFAFTVGSYCDISDYVVANPDVSTATAKLYKAVFMAKAYNEAHGIDDTLTIEELRALPGAPGRLQRVQVPERLRLPWVPGRAGSGTRCPCTA